MSNEFMQPEYMAPKLPQTDRYADVNFEQYSDKEVTDFLNKILRGEISAVESYQQVIEKFSAEANSLQLTRVQGEHSRAVVKLRECIEENLEAPSEDSGIWGKAVATVVGAAKLAGNKASLKALVEGEEHGISLYDEALKMNLSPNTRNLIESDLKPALQRHISELKQMIEMQ